MTAPAASHAPAYDPFGEPMDCASVGPAACGAETVASPRSGGRSARRAAIAFWALALLLVGGRIYLSDQPSALGKVADAMAAVTQVTYLR